MAGHISRHPMGFMMVYDDTWKQHKPPSGTTIPIYIHVICWNRTSMLCRDPPWCFWGSTSSKWRYIPSAKQPRALPFPKICFLKGSLLHPIFQSCLVVNICLKNIREAMYPKISEIDPILPNPCKRSTWIKVLQGYQTKQVTTKSQQIWLLRTNLCIL